MSYANILTTGGKISSQYLPTEAVVTPNLDDVLTAGNDAGNLSITNLASLQIGAAGPIPAGLGLFVDGGVNAVFTGKLGVSADKYLVESDANTLQIESLTATTGQVSVLCDNGLNVTPVDTTGSGRIRIFNGTGEVGGQTYYEMYTAGTTGGGLIVGNFEIFGYNGTNINPIFQSNSLGSAITLGAGFPAGGSVISVDGPLGASRVFDTVYNKPFESGQATLNAGVVTVNIPGALLTSVIVATCIGQETSQSSTVVVESVGVPNPGDVVFRATNASDNRTFNFIAVV